MLNGEVCESTVYEAIKMGYRHIDGAQGKSILYYFFAFILGILLFALVHS